MPPYAEIQKQIGKGLKQQYEPPLAAPLVGAVDPIERQGR